MKSSVKYLKLWQKKRSELPVDINPAAGWAQMHQMLDKHLPPPPPAAAATATSGLVKSAALKLLTAAILVPGAAAVIYLSARHQVPAKSHKQKRQDSTTHILSKTQMQQADTVQEANQPFPADSLPPAAKQTATLDSVPADSRANAGGTTLQAAAGGTSALVSDSVPANGGLKPATTRQGDGVLHAATGQNNASVTLPAPSNKQPASKSEQAAFIRHNNAKNDLAESTLATSTAARRQLKATAGKSPRMLQPALVAPGSLVVKPEAWQALPLAGSLTLKPQLLPVNAASNALMLKPEQAKTKPAKSKKVKDKPIKIPKNTISLQADYGLLAGASLPGTTGITSIWPGAFVQLNAGSKWAMGMQLRLFNPQKVSGNYTFKNESKTDTTLSSFTVADSRKLYSIQLPVYLVYKPTQRLGLKAGALINLPVKQGAGNSVIGPRAIRDTAYAINTAATLGNTSYQTGLNFSLVAGGFVNYNRFIFGVDYIQPLSTRRISSALGNYTFKGSQLQLSIGFKLNK